MEKAMEITAKEALDRRVITSVASDSVTTVFADCLENRINGEYVPNICGLCKNIPSISESDPKIAELEARFGKEETTALKFLQCNQVPLEVLKKLLENLRNKPQSLEAKAFVAKNIDSYPFPAEEN